jgi:FAD-dependent halogenase
MNQAFDVAVIGGGPAGSSAGTLLAKAGRRVVIFEKEKFPRFRVGKSMLQLAWARWSGWASRKKSIAAAF